MIDILTFLGEKLKFSSSVDGKTILGGGFRHQYAASYIGVAEADLGRFYTASSDVNACSWPSLSISNAALIKDT